MLQRILDLFQHMGSGVTEAEIVWVYCVLWDGCVHVMSRDGTSVVKLWIADVLRYNRERGRVFVSYDSASGMYYDLRQAMRLKTNRNVLEPMVKAIVAHAPRVGTGLMSSIVAQGGSLRVGVILKALAALVVPIDQLGACPLRNFDLDVLDGAVGVSGTALAHTPPPTRALSVPTPRGGDREERGVSAAASGFSRCHSVGIQTEPTRLLHTISENTESAESLREVFSEFMVDIGAVLEHLDQATANTEAAEKTLFLE